MKCIFVGVFSQRSTNNSQVQCLENQGCEVVRFPYRQLKKELGREKMEGELGRLIESEKPDFVLFSKCNEIKVSIIKKYRELTKMILWYMDPINKSWNIHLRAKIRQCHAAVFALRRPYKKAKKYSKNVYHVHEGFDPEIDKPKNLEKKYDVSFIGHLDKKRERYYKKFNFNSGCSDRVYKVLAAKGFLLTEPWPHIEDDFTIGKDFDVFSSQRELREKIDYYLAHDEEREFIADHGWRTVQKYDRNNWAREIIDIYKKIE
jgi:spore maturation protein CgeB